jgi:hypothetical protein
MWSHTMDFTIGKINKIKICNDVEYENIIGY